MSKGEKTINVIGAYLKIGNMTGSEAFPPVQVFIESRSWNVN